MSVSYTHCLPVYSPVSSSVKYDGSTRRFYRSVDVVRRVLSEGRDAGSSGWSVRLDGRDIVTTQENPFLLPSQSLAAAVALEWEAQRDRIVQSSMPLTHLAYAAIDRALHSREEMLLRFDAVIAVDSTCTRVDEPAVLRRLQSKHWDPLLQHLAARYGIVLSPTSELAAPPTAADTQAQLQALVRSVDPFTLAALDSVASFSKSLVVALCLLDGSLDLQSAYEAARVDENYQMRTYGQVHGMYGHGVDIEWSRMQLAAARVFCQLAWDEDGRGHTAPPFTPPTDTAAAREPSSLSGNEAARQIQYVFSCCLSGTGLRNLTAQSRIETETLIPRKNTADRFVTLVLYLSPTLEGITGRCLRAADSSTLRLSPLPTVKEGQTIYRRRHMTMGRGGQREPE